MDYAKKFHQMQTGKALPWYAKARRLWADEIPVDPSPNKLGAVPGLCFPDALATLADLQGDVSERRALWVQRGATAHAVAIWWDKKDGWKAWANDIPTRSMKRGDDPREAAKELGYFDTDAYFLEPL